MSNLWPALSCYLLVLAPIASAKDDERNVNYIFGGQVIGVVDAPYQAAIFYNNQFHCGGNVIAPIWILTAGHCVVDQALAVLQADLLFVRVGTDDANKPGQGDYLVDSVFLHLHFSLAAFNFDVALLRLTQPMAFTDRVRCIQMAQPGTPTTSGESVYVTGYGQTFKDAPDPLVDTKLRAIDISILEHDECQLRYPSIVITERMFCAAAPPKGTCFHDSGGPAVVQGQLLGLVTGGGICGDASPGIFALIPSMRDWIDDTIALNTAYNPPLGQCV